MRDCIKCGVPKPEEGYYQYSYKRVGTCIECWNIGNKIKQAEDTAWMRSMKTDPCTDCGVAFPPTCMDWDHVRGTKKYEIARMRGFARATILEEMTKCDLICANCHRIRTNDRRERGETDYTRKDHIRRVYPK